MIRLLARAARRHILDPLVSRVRIFISCNRSLWRIALAEMEAESPPG